MRQATWLAIENEFARAPSSKAGPVSMEEIGAASTTLGIEFAPDYREFVSRYGSAIIGAYRIFGLRLAGIMGKGTWTVVEATLHFRAQGWRGVRDWCIISIDHAGNPIGIALDGRVMLSDHDAGEVACVGENFEDFIRRRCLKLPKKEGGGKEREHSGF